MTNQAAVMPLFYYCGSKKWEIRSDYEWIEWQLKRLPENLKHKAVKQYENLYLSECRMTANRWLLDYCNEHGCSTEELRRNLFGRETVVSKSAQQRADSAVDKVKAAKLASRKKIIDD